MNINPVADELIGKKSGGLPEVRIIVVGKEPVRRVVRLALQSVPKK